MLHLVFLFISTDVFSLTSVNGILFSLLVSVVDLVSVKYNNPGPVALDSALLGHLVWGHLSGEKIKCNPANPRIR